MNDLIRHGMEFMRAIRNKHYEETPNGVLFPRMGAFVAGQYTTWVNDRDMQVDPNVVPAEGIAQILKSGLNGTPCYIAGFTQNVTPNGSLTAALFDTNLTEFTDYDESTRRAWTVPTDPVSGAYSNSASPAVFTTSTGIVDLDVYGAGLLTQAAKEATTGKLIAASKFSSKRTLNAADKLTIQYDLSATSA